MSLWILNSRGLSVYCKKYIYITTDQNTAWFWQLLVVVFLIINAFIIVTFVILIDSYEIVFFVFFFAHD